jgi:uncharacterized protein (DUF1778 family)
LFAFGDRGFIPRRRIKIALFSHWTYNEMVPEPRSVMPQPATAASPAERRARPFRLGFRVDAATKLLVERAAALERRSLTDFCLTALADATRETIARHESLVLSERDRAAFFDALVHAPRPNARLRRAFRSARERVAG